MARLVYLEVAYGLLQRTVVVEHHAPELEGLYVVLVQHEGFLETFHGRLKITQLSGQGEGDMKRATVGVPLAERRGEVGLSTQTNSEHHGAAIPVGLSQALICIYEVRLQLQCLFECLNGFLMREKHRELSHSEKIHKIRPAVALILDQLTD